MHELDILYANLLEGARKLSPGKERYDVLKELGRLRLRLDELSQRPNREKTALGARNIPPAR